MSTVRVTTASGSVYTFDRAAGQIRRVPGDGASVLSHDGVAHAYDVLRDPAIGEPLVYTHSGTRLRLTTPVVSIEATP